MIKPTIYILACVTSLLTIVSCIDADPLSPNGPILDVDQVDIVFTDPLFIFQNEKKSVELKNSGDSELVITGIEINDGDGNDLSEFTAVIGATVIPPGGVTILEVTFQPSEFIRYNRELIIKSNFENEALIRLEGIGVPKVSNQEVWNFTSQFSVDQFEKEGYDIVNTKEVFISSTVNSVLDPIVDLSALSIIKEVDLLQIANNSILEDLTGLDNLLIKEDLIVRSNQSLKSLNQLNGSMSSSFNIEIESNRNLESLDFLQGLTTIRDLKIINNRALKDFKGAETIQTIDGDLVIFDNDSLISLEGLEGVSVTIFDELSGENRFLDDVSIRDNRELINFCGLLNVLSGSQDFFGDIVIANNKLEISLVQLQMGTCN